VAGRFLTVEETAMQLGVEPDEINRLVDRKKLFPMRDGGTMKFRYDDVVRYAQSSGESSDASSGLSLDFDMKSSVSKPASGLELDGLDLGDTGIGDNSIGDGASIFDDPGPAVSKIVSETVLRGGEIDASNISVAAASLPGISNVSGIAISEDILGDSLALGSAAATGSGSKTGSGATGGGSAPLSGLGSGVIGSGLGVSGIAGVTGVADGTGLSVAGESGLSLEDDDVQLSGIQLSGIDLSSAGSVVAGGSGIDLGAVGDDGGDVEGGTMLAGDAFELGAVGGDDESASVVIATDSESGDSSFFGAAMGGGDSSSSDDSSMQVATSGMQFPAETFAGTSFSALQICGLVSCSLLLLAGGFICFDLVRSIGSVRGAAFSTPILDSLTTSFGLK
jgi:excisionase family DNA binding protein